MNARRLSAIALACMAVAGCISTRFYRFNTRVKLIAAADRVTVYAKVGEEVGDSIGYVLKGDTLQGVGLRYTRLGRLSREMQCLILYNGDSAFVPGMEIITLKEPGAGQQPPPDVEE